MPHRAGLFRAGCRWSMLGIGIAAFVLLLAGAPGGDFVLASAENGVRPNLARAKVFLAAGDYRHALEACEQEIAQAPSAAGYVYLTYLYQAIGGYLDHLAKTDGWKEVEQLYLNLASRDTEDLIDPPGGLARMAMEVIKSSVRQKSDANAAMATRLDPDMTQRLWQQQAAWREAQPESWWKGVPASWNW